MVQVPTQQIPGVYHRRIGDIVVTALSDGYLDGTVDVLQNVAPDRALQILAENFRPGRRTSVNCYAIHSAGRLALIETGCRRPASCRIIWRRPASIRRRSRR